MQLTNFSELLVQLPDSSTFFTKACRQQSTFFLLHRKCNFTKFSNKKKVKQVWNDCRVR